jgi:acyl carrier protein
MGLDSVELAMSFEETFGVTISDAEAVTCGTPADVIALVLGKIQTSGTKGCLSQRGFYVLRRALTEKLGIDRRAVTLDTGIRSLCPGESDPELWESLKSATQARRWPSLVRPRWLVGCLWLLTGTVLIGLFQVTSPVLAWAGAILAGGAGILMTSRFENRIPPAYSRVRDLVPFAITSSEVSWSPDDVAQQVKQIVMDQLGVSEEMYREDAHFVHDFGMD